jgi:predicted Zn-dependent protease
MRRFAILMFCGLLAACATSPLGRSHLSFVSDSQMSQMGLQAYSDIKQKTPISSDSRLTAYVNCVAQNIVQQVSGGQPWEVTLFQKDEANAFALPGGKIGVYTGLLKYARNQDQLAAVLGHEVSHVVARHSAERVSEQLAVNTGLQLGQSLGGASGGLLASALGLGAQYGILLPFSRTQESEADLLGLQLMAKAGFDPRQSVELWRNMEAGSQGQPPAFMSTHPSHGSRIANLNQHMPQALNDYQAASASGRRPKCG